jgi:hypothetical protein
MRGVPWASGCDAEDWREWKGILPNVSPRDEQEVICGDDSLMESPVNSRVRGCLVRKQDNLLKTVIFGGRHSVVAAV